MEMEQLRKLHAEQMDRSGSLSHLSSAPSSTPLANSSSSNPKTTPKGVDGANPIDVDTPPKPAASKAKPSAPTATATKINPFAMMMDKSAQKQMAKATTPTPKKRSAPKKSKKVRTGDPSVT
jgi:hypothetical protein